MQVRPPERPPVKWIWIQLRFPRGPEPGVSRETPGELDMDTVPAPRETPPEEVDMDTGPAPEGAGTGGLPGDPVDMDISTSPGVSREVVWPTTPVVDIFPLWTHSQRRLSRR